ncbi:MAG: DsrE/DsrF/DrsH-like family protein [Methanomassiliicoccales archaeon]|nr:DsrE/DsrF/DrsH-like family protein [Methanomassiliicoccales archaeon]
MAKKLVMVVSEGTFDKAMQSMMIANTAASMGMDVHIFHTFFGLPLLLGNADPKLPGEMAPQTDGFKEKMKSVGVEDYGAMKKMAIELGVHMYACSTTMELMGVKKEHLTEGVVILGAAGFLNIAADSDMQFFIG